MSKTIETTLEIAEVFMLESKFVHISKKSIDNFVEMHKDKVLAHKQKTISGRRLVKDKDIEDAVLLELLVDSINYNFWYGSYKIRPNGSSSTKMASLMMEAYEETKNYSEKESLLVDSFIKKLSIERYPNLANREKHLHEVVTNFGLVKRIANKIKSGEESLDDLDDLVMNLAGFADDIFLKRAFLFFISLNRHYGWYENCISELPIPTDYQIPKVLNCLGILTYTQELKSKIDTQELIPAGSKMECEIRAGSMLACKDVAEKIGVTMADIDDYVFSIRNLYKEQPFHLTITTWY